MSRMSTHSETAGLEAAKTFSSEQVKPHSMTANWHTRSGTLHNRAIMLLGGSDLLIIGLIFTLAAITCGASGYGWMIFTAALLPTYCVIAMGNHAFHSYALSNPFIAIVKGCRSLIMAVGLLILMAFYLKSADFFPRLTITVGSVGGLLGLAMARYLIVPALPRLIGGNPFNAILICDGSEEIPPGEFSVVIMAESFFDPDVHDPHNYDRLASSLAMADRVVIACPLERRASWTQAMQGAHIQAEIIVNELRPLSPLGLGPDRDAPSVIVATGPLSLPNRAVKRLFDLVVATLALIILLPLLLIVALLIKLDSPGPVLFKQMRIGRGNRLFSVYKFRSMRTEVCDTNADRLTARNDDRVTRIGKILRKTSIDELPQLIQVLTGRMSLVGPRPHATGARAASKLYWEVDDRYWSRHAAKPGLTGLAQVRGYRGNTEVEDDLLNRLSSDLEYLQSWSFWRDIKILFLTFRVLFHRNAF
ncbi:exopolysaccharide biosynthesis polyprenyl glycosylphosphotransferase family protein [Exiguobacterium sp. S17]|nr:exopolysaccharide biosynthesis polyprenyl glycosylphosphotransferase family protein [Exiguobacterium sp. S17]